MARTGFLFFIICLLNSWEAASQLHLRPYGDSIAQKVSLRVLPQNFYSQHLGFFCKKEVQLQKLTRLPVFFRLGEKSYVDRLEGKPYTLATREPFKKD